MPKEKEAKKTGKLKLLSGKLTGLSGKSPGPVDTEKRDIKNDEAAERELAPSEKALDALSEKLDEEPPPLNFEGTIVDSYFVPADGDPESSAEVFVVDNNTFGQLIVRVPFLTKHETRVLQLLKDNLASSIPAETIGEPQQVITKYVWETAEKAGILESVKKSYKKYIYYLLKDFVGFGEIDPLINDDNIEEISVTRSDLPVRVFHRKYTNYGFMETNIVYQDEERLQAFVRRMAQLGGTTVSLAQPSLEVTLHGISDRRVSATLGDEISRPGSTFTIRKQKVNPITIVRMAAPEPARPFPAVPPQPDPVMLDYSEDAFPKTLTALMAAYFWLLLEKTADILIAGETASGKTTLMNAILALANPKVKIVSAEDVLEINLPDTLHWERLKTRVSRAGVSPTGGRYEFTLSDLLKLALRFSPTILSLGEMRGEESETVATAITLGFSTITTVHAEDAERCIQRITNPPMAFKEGHVRDITAIVSMRKITLPDMMVARRIISVDEVKPVGHDSHEIINVFKYDFATDSFSPNTPAEVVKRSYRLKEIAEQFGWTEEHLLRSLTNRATYITKAAGNNEFSPDDLAKMVKEYITKESLRELGGHK